MRTRERLQGDGPPVLFIHNRAEEDALDEGRRVEKNRNRWLRTPLAPFRTPNSNRFPDTNSGFPWLGAKWLSHLCPLRKKGGHLFRIVSKGKPRVSKNPY